MKKLILMIVGIYLFLGGGLAWGDATIETTFRTGGIKGAGATEGTTIRRYQANKMVESSSSKFTGAILSRLAGGSENINITRIDKGVYWSIDPKDRTYSESPIEAFQKKESSKERGEKEKPSIRITKSEFSVKKTGASETINGFSCEEYLLTWLLEWEEIETKAKSRSTMTTNLWTTPETATMRKAQAEENAFHKAYAQKLGVSHSPEEAKQMGMAAFAAASGAPPEEIEKGLIRMKNEMSKIKGYPIRSVVSWNMESEKGGAAAREAEPSSDSTSGLPGNISGLLSGLKGRILQKKGEEKPSPTGKDAPFFSGTTEVKSINIDSVPAEVFEIPAGYTRK
ncbi:MAG: hypothetical protein OEW45_17860 [Deltaproteobacteria bacterium]|jgi:hypothetical protein|nr:hypothetical protein [Deltaproteobacteria bacterium]